eukprot:TRINITY_DN41689_c3_g1_i1.p1 TRINITY_DN41689_c3_g1~~TRINITY_DN41689_c3_g1_i1.p1  ORF type:complete len:495 (-),score=76.25 TRINITY_DN41689_c3_g1_i1:193-1677(-)
MACQTMATPDVEEESVGYECESGTNRGQLKPALEGLERRFCNMEGGFEALKKDVAAMTAEVTVLREFLLDSGQLQQEKFLARLHRRRFTALQAAISAQATAREQRPTFGDLLQVPAFMLTLGTSTSAFEVRSMSCTAKEPCRAASSTLEAVRAMHPGHVYIQGGYHGQNGSFSLERYAPGAVVWERLPPLREKRSAVAAGVLDNKLYFCGGWNGEHRLSQVERFDIATGCWEKLPPMLQGRSHHTVSHVAGRLYICGGFDGATSLTSVECFDPDGGRWIKLSPMFERRRRASAVVWKSQLIICGGYDGSTQLNSVELYRPLSDEWRRLPSMLSRRAVSMAGMVGDMLYVFGTEDDTRVGAWSSSAERLPIALDETAAAAWQALPPMLTRRQGASASICKGCLYVCGGWDGRHRLASVERFNPSSESWELLEPMLEQRDRAAMACLAGRLYVCGGFNGDRDLKTSECFDPETGKWMPLPDMTERRSSAAALPAHS